MTLKMLNIIEVISKLKEINDIDRAIKFFEDMEKRKRE